MSQTLLLSKDLAFHTLEGEGPSIGRPAIFLRMSLCNLTCQGWSTPENPHGCDTYTSWSVKNKFTFEELFTFLEERGYSEFLKRGDCLKLTGGEPLIQQKVLLDFTEEMVDKYDLEKVLDLEFETNATIMPHDNWTKKYYATFICSPKLSNNGDPEEKRYRPEVLEWHARNHLSYFKFVVCQESDIDEIYKCFIDPFKIKRSKVWLMPECATREAHASRAPMVAEICKKHGFGFSTRLQILIWNQACGV